MKRLIILYGVLIISIATVAQTKFVFGETLVSSSDGNEEHMDRFMKKSYKLPWLNDSLVDTLIINKVVLIGIKSTSYYITFKYDTTRIAISIERTRHNSEFQIKTYWESRNIKRCSRYNKNHLLSGEWVEYYNDGSTKLSGKYNNGKKNGKWKYYDEKGNKVLVQEFKDNILVSSNDKGYIYVRHNDN